MSAGSAENTGGVGAENRGISILGFIMPEEVVKLITQIDPAPALQTYRFGCLLANLMQSVFPRFSSFNFVPVQDYPVVRRAVFPSRKFILFGREHWLLGFVNLLILKHISRFVGLLRKRRAINANEFLLIHGLHMPNLLFGAFMRGRNMKVGVVLTDEQGVVLASDGKLRRLLKRIDRKLAVALCRRFDFGIALSPGLADLYMQGRPIMLLPGIYDTGLEQMVGAARTEAKSGSTFRVLYFGHLNSAYGIEALLNAVPMLPPNIEVRLFGHGPLQERIVSDANHYANLYFGGLVDRERLALEMAQCDLMINPRPAASRIALMSSPSKLLEFAAAGKPVMTTKLPSLPEPVLEAALLLQNVDPAHIAASIGAAAELPIATLQAKGLAFHDAMKSRYSFDSLGSQLAHFFQGVSGERRPDGR